MSGKVDWYYIRPSGCTACNKVSAFLEQRGIDVIEKVPASRKLQSSDAEALLKDVDTVIAMKGRKVDELKVGEHPGDEIVSAMLGPTGNLRAPLLLVGRTCLVGYNDEVFEQTFQEPA